LSRPLAVGWREWLALPELKVPWIKVKVDTGARTSALNAQDITIFQRDQFDWVRFSLYPMQQRDAPRVVCEVPVQEYRNVKDSGGNMEKRPVIRTHIDLGSLQSAINITLTDRSTMTFRMLLGRTAIPHDATVLPRRSFLQGGSRHYPPES
jgi:hypothetical protein